MKCCITTIEDNTEIEYESETSSLSYSFARYLTLALQSYKLHLISPELPKGSSILITDIESESRFAMTSTKAREVWNRWIAKKSSSWEMCACLI